MEITAIDEAALKAIDWNKVINMPAYKLYIEVVYYDVSNLLTAENIFPFHGL